jgi:polyisoprenoid-binding protein YceI
MKRLMLPILLLFTTLSLAAQTKPHVIDHAHSQINFVGEARFISAHGFFEKWSAEVNLDPQKVENSSLKITIDAASINTRVARRDTHLRSKDFFWVEQHPQITFTSKKVIKTAERKYTVTGDLVMRGVTKEITVPLTMVFYENNRGRFRGTFEINRQDYGISYNSRLNPVEDIVQVQFDISVQDQAAANQRRPGN